MGDCSLIRYLYIQGLSPKEIREDMVTTLGNDVPSYRTVKNVRYILVIKTQLMYTIALRLLALRGWRTLCVRRRLPSVVWGHIGLL